MRKIITKSIFFIILLACLVHPQDSTRVADSTSAHDSVFVMEKSAWGAVLRSAILPGWGQIYNESYLKVPVVWGISGWFIYNYLANNKKYLDYKKLYLKSNIIDDKNLREFYRDQRDLFAMYFAFAYLANLVDAYVDAHLFDFSVSEDFMRKSPMFNIRLYFK